MAFPQPSDFDPVGIPVGQIYTNPSTKTKYEWLGTHWSVYHPPGSPEASKEFAVSTPSSDEPQEPNDGDFWYDTTDDNLQVRYNEEWISAAMNKEQSQTLDNLKSSLEYPLYIDGELELVGELVESDKSFSRYEYGDDSYWPKGSDNKYNSNSTSCRKLQFRFSSNHYNGHYNLPDLEDVINSAIENKNKGLVNIKFSYQRSGRQGYTYSPTVTELTLDGRYLHLTFSSDTYVGTGNDNQKLSHVKLKIELRNPIKDQIVLRHESRTMTLMDPAKVVFRQVYPVGSSSARSQDYYKLDSNGNIDTGSSSNAYGYFIPEDVLSQYFYYYNDPHNRVIRKRFVRPTDEINISTYNSKYNKTVKPEDISWVNLTYNNKTMSGLKLGFESAQSYAYSYASFTLQNIFEYDVAYDLSQQSIPSPPDSHVLVYL